MPKQKEAQTFSERLSIEDNSDGLASLGVQYEGRFIVEPFMSACRSFKVSPDIYGLSESEAAFIQRFNESLKLATEAAIEAGAKAMRAALDVSGGEFTEAYFSGAFERNKIRHALAVYALEEYDNRSLTAKGGEAQTSPA